MGRASSTSDLSYRPSRPPIPSRSVTTTERADAGDGRPADRTQVEQVFIDGVEQSLETRHTRLYREFKDPP
jgi:hypothetical protein